MLNGAMTKAAQRHLHKGRVISKSQNIRDYDEKGLRGAYVALPSPSMNEPQQERL